MASLYSICQEISRITPGYRWGGGHNKPIAAVRGSEGLDCSGSVSRALYLAGFFPFSWALVSGEFWRVGKAGYGEDFTIHYKWNHVWIEFHGKHAGWRFDTSPWGIGGRGPKLRKGSRGKLGFKQRHIPGH